MAGFIKRKKELRDRSRILREVYEENLRITRKSCSSNPRRKTPAVPRTRALAYFVICLTSVVLYSFDLVPISSTSSNVVETSIVATDSMVVTAPPLDGNVADFKTLERNSGVPLSRMLGLDIRNIVIDAGHGGEDLGAIGKTGLVEKDITLQIAKEVKTRLNERGYANVYMTRSDDSALPLQERVAFAEKTSADLFLSIHVNWLPNTPVNLVETFYFGPSSDERIIRLAGAENRGSGYGLSDFKEVVERLGTMMKLQESRKFAHSIQDTLYSNISKLNPKIRDNGVKRAPFAVLLGPDVPSVLAEISCLSNPGEEQRLKSEDYRKNIAEYLAVGITHYLNMGADDDTE